MSHVSTLRLHRLRLGELSPTEEGEIRRHLADCPRCAARLDLQEQQRQAFVAAPIPEALRPQPAPWARWLRWAGLALLPVAAALFLVVRLPEISTAPEPPALRAETPGLRTKGEAAHLEAWIDAPAGPVALRDGQPLSAGARVQLRFDPGPWRYVTLLGRDGQGVVEVYGTIPAKGAGLQDAPFALTLDDTPGVQQFYGLLSQIRPDPDDLTAALSGPDAEAALTAAVPGAQLVSLSFPKE